MCGDGDGTQHHLALLVDKGSAEVQDDVCRVSKKGGGIKEGKKERTSAVNLINMSDYTYRRERKLVRGMDRLW